MKIHFKIQYKARWGETIQLVVFQENVSDLIFPMESDIHSAMWKTEIDISKDETILNYQYQLSVPGQKPYLAYGGSRKLFLKNINGDEVFVNDIWRGPYSDGPFNTVVFRDCFFKRENKFLAEKPEKSKLTLIINCPQIEPDRHLVISGNQEILGNWDLSKKVRIDDNDYPYWKIELDVSQINFPLEYKYLIVDTVTDEVLSWEEGENRKIDKVNPEGINIFNNENFRRTIDSWKGAGVAIPVFSLRSENSFGTGEFLDLKLMVDWAVKTGQKLIQTLPVNDTILHHSNMDSYPYNAVSVYALHPLYLNPEKIGIIPNKERRAYYNQKKDDLNGKTFTDYQHVMDVKWEYLREIYSIEKHQTFLSDKYKTFFDANKEWLVPYAAFSYLRDQFKTSDFKVWPLHGVYNEKEIEKLVSPENEWYDQIALYYFLQFHLFLQLTEVHEYARANGVVIKGDLPIGVSSRSVDTWVNPELFNLNVQAGAPPDDFSVTGQNWGFPTYNWEKMEADGYDWWKKRFGSMANYFDAYRIDHILGFFRIWEIPDTDVWGLNGSFNPSLPFTIEELQRRGVKWDEDRFIKPFIKEEMFKTLFGGNAGKVISDFLLADGIQYYKFKPEFDTQRKIKAYFEKEGYKNGDKDILIQDGLFQLHCEVLFLRDLRRPDYFHPRIAFHDSFSFRDLPEESQKILDGIYVDYFYYRHNEFWKDVAYRKLPALIASTSMLVCGEDLGMVPASVPDVMKALEILSLEIQRMPKKSNTEFAMPADAPYLSVCTTSTHDMNPVRAWWEEDREITQRFYNHALEIQGEAPEKCEQWIAEKIIDQHLKSKAMWVILPWQDWISTESRLWLKNPIEERINVPSDSKNFWSYRMHITLEELLADDQFNNKIKEMILNAGR